MTHTADKIKQEHPFIDYSYCNCSMCLGWGDVDGKPCVCTGIEEGTSIFRSLTHVAKWLKKEKRHDKERP